jgi:hypothetical protein
LCVIVDMCLHKPVTKELAYCLSMERYLHKHFS